MVTSSLALTPKAQSGKRRSWSTLLLCLPAVLLLFFFFGLPLAQNAARSVGISNIAGTHSAFTLHYYQKLFTDSYYRGVIGDTLKISLYATVLCLAVGYPVAYYMVRRAERLAVPLLFILVTPLLTSIIMRTFGWRVLFARRGLVNELLMQLHIIDHPLNVLNGVGIVYVAMVHVMVPFMVLSIVPVLRSVDRRLEESSRILGAGAFRTFLTITLPLSLEGIVTGCVLVFMVTNGSFITMLLLGDGSMVTLPLLIFQQFSQSQDIGFASAMGNLLLFMVLVCLYLQGRFAPGARRA